MIPSIVCEQLQRGLTEYLKTTFPISSEVFAGCIDRFLDARSMFKGPYVTLRMPFREAARENPWFEALELPFAPYLHQKRAFDRLAGEAPRSTLVATGTGSGKTECFLYPLLEHCWRHRGEKGIKALLIYPMNALATDQARRIAGLIYRNAKLKGNVVAGKYTGDSGPGASRGMGEQELITDREMLRQNPPDILLTNYKMLDYLLIRSDDFPLWSKNGPETLKYIVVDEFHTFDGAQGTDLACLLRRLKKRLEIPEGFLCCVGTSATLGDAQSQTEMVAFASEVFGEPFPEDAVIGEQRQTADEFLRGTEIQYTALPDKKALSEIANAMTSGSERDFIRLASLRWFGDATLGDDDNDARVRELMGERLRGHYFFHELLRALEGGASSYEELLAELSRRNRILDFYSKPDRHLLLLSLIGLVSYARILQVHVQIWFRELRRLLGKVDPEKPDLALSDDLTEGERGQYLPVVNCRDCGVTGWVSMMSDSFNTQIIDLRGFYEDFFSSSRHTAYFFPVSEKRAQEDPDRGGYLCPRCLKWNEAPVCSGCGNSKTVPVLLERPNAEGGEEKSTTYCPICGSRGGMTLIGAQNSTLISAGISELFASRFNDDKKLLAFSDSVQDASHRAGFFNARTWRFNLRLAIQQYLKTAGADKSISDFTTEFVEDWERRMTLEDFAATFIAPNMTWFRDFEHLVEHGEFPSAREQTDRLLESIRSRMRLEALYEYGFNCRIGRTLEKSGSSVLAFTGEAYAEALDRFIQRVRNELGEFRNVDESVLQHFAFGFFLRMKNAGGIFSEVLNAFIESGGSAYLLSSDKVKWMPGLTRARRVPRFLEMTQKRSHKGAFDDLSRRSLYFRWALRALNGASESDTALDMERVYPVFTRLLEEFVRAKVLEEREVQKRERIYGLSPKHARVTGDVARIACDRCGHTLSIPGDDLESALGLPCFHPGCPGSYAEKPFEDDFYRRLYENGDIRRIYAAEHSSLVSAERRAYVEQRFKKTRAEQKRWDVNLLSCTPTLELGIDIGDLSSVALCSVPPAQTQFLQRIGRAGRRDGNALSLVATNLVPHDMYFFEEPKEMIAGEVKPPAVFLNASAVLERQLLAFCFDRWIKIRKGAQSVPKTIANVLANIDHPEKDVFPHNLLRFIRQERESLLEGFFSLFGPALEEETIAKLKAFADDSDQSEGSLSSRILIGFRDIRSERESITAQITSLQNKLAKVKALPTDSSREQEMKDLEKEIGALAEVKKAINAKNVYNFLSDEGLLPNYAFPEAGVSLKAVIYRRLGKNREYDSEPDETKKYEHYVYEYMRPAASAIAEFAPENTFYSEGRKIVIDQIDTRVSKPAEWRLCPNCSHAELSSAVEHTGSCPRCGSRAWADIGQVRTMLKLRQVFASEEYDRSFSGDESDDREKTFFRRNLYVDVDASKDVLKAYWLANVEKPFGFEFVRKATLREINFGGQGNGSESLMVAGRSEERNGFRICRSCGMVQSEGLAKKKKRKHYPFCSAAGDANPDNYEQKVYLYREFQSEVLRILIPATTLEWNETVKQTFIAAVMLGLKETFGSVEHLKATVTEEPAPGNEYRKNYLVLYDSVPGGTGYLKHLSKTPDAIFDMLDKCLRVLVKCECASQPKRDGCYRCLFAYKQSRYLGSISKKVAIDILSGLLNNREHLVAIPTINEIDTGALMESELERMFLEALKKASSPERPIELYEDIDHGSQGFTLQIGKNRYFIAAQTFLSEKDGVFLPTRADFVIYPRDPDSDEQFLPIVIYTDGFSYHRNRLADDLNKRMAVLRSGNFYVWSLTYQDVKDLLDPPGGNFRDLFAPERLPASELEFFNQCCRLIENNGRAWPRDLVARDSFRALLDLLENRDRVRDFKNIGFVYGWFGASRQNLRLGQAAERLPLELSPFRGMLENLIGGTYAFPEEKVTWDFFVNEDDVRDYRARLVSVLDDADPEQEGFAAEWNGFLRAFNFFQFQKDVLFTTKSAIAGGLPSFFEEPAEAGKERPATVQDGWESALDDIIDEMREYAERLRNADCPPPDDVGYEWLDARGAIVGEAEMVWRSQQVAVLRPDYGTIKKAIENEGWRAFVAGVDQEAAVCETLR